MILSFRRRFSPPSHLVLHEQVRYCVSVIDRYRQELPQLRTATSILKRQKKKIEDEVVYWRQKYQEKKEENEKLKKEIGELEEKIEQFTKTTNRYQVALFDHGNFKSPLEDEGKQKGGQVGHLNTNREGGEDLPGYERKRVFVSHCPDCNKRLHRVSGVRQKQLLDIILNPQAVRLIVESERQWCGNCKREVNAKDERSLPFSEYGMNTFMMALLLRYRCLLPLSKITLVFSIGYGLPISPAGLVSIFRQARAYLGKKYEALKTTVREGDIIYTDETGWQVRGVNAWMWIMANEKATVYVAAESRGKGIAQEMYGNSQAYSMHDGYGAYTNTIPQNKHLYCWSHLLRFCFEETVNKPLTSESIKIRDKLVEIYHLKKDSYYQAHPRQLEREADRRMRYLLKYKSKDPTTLALLHRLREQHEGLTRSLIVSENGTNNFAEQELRPIALTRKISYGSDTFTGMETTAVLASVVQTYARTRRETFFPSLAASLRAGFANS